MQTTTTLRTLTLAALFTSPTLFAADLPGKGITVHPVQSTLPEETFQTEIINRALKQLGYDVTPIEEVEYNVAYTAIAAGDATFMAANWLPMQQDMYDASGGDRKFYRQGTYISNAAQGYMIDKKTAEKYNITDISQLKDAGTSIFLLTDKVYRNSRNPYFLHFIRYVLLYHELRS